MNRIKMIITDLDGTLLHSDKSISDYTRNILSRCREKGIIITVATARDWLSAEYYINEVNPDYEITTDGALIHSGSRLIYECGLDIDKTNNIVSDLKSICSDSGIIVAAMHNVYWNIQKAGANDLYKTVYNDYSGPLEEVAYKIAVTLPSKDIAENIAARHDCKLRWYRDGLWCSFVHKDSDKLQAIHALCRHTGIDIGDVAAFGDDLSDIEMLKACGRGIAVSNALQGVREIADEITGSNNEDGVARYIEERIL
jgi:Cof subfamily protein (haloacid dehalogenase superfamily)